MNDNPNTDTAEDEDIGDIVEDLFAWADSPGEFDPTDWDHISRMTTRATISRGPPISGTRYAKYHLWLSKQDK